MDDYQLMGGGGYGMSDDSGGGTRLIEDSSGMVSGMSYGRGPNPGMSGQALGPGMVPSHMPGTHQNPNSVMTGMVPQQSIQQHSANHLNAGNIMAYHQMAAQHGYQQSEVPQKLQHYGGYGGPQGVGGMGMANSQFPSSSRLQQMAEPSLAAGTTHQPQQQGSQSLTPMTPYQQQSMMGGGQYNQRPQMGAAGGVHMPSNASQYPGSYSVSHQQQQPAPQHQQPAVQQMGPGNEVWQGSMMHSPQHHRPYTGQGPSYTQHSQPAPMSPVQHGPASMTASPVPMQVPRPATPNQNQYVGGQDYGVHPGVQASAPQRPYYSVGVPSSHTSQNGMQVGHVAGAASGTVSQTSSHIPVSQSEQMLSSYSSQGQFTPSSQTLGVRPTQSAANAMSHSSAGQMMSGNRTMQRVGYSSPHHHVNSGVQQGSPARMPQYQCSTYSPGQPYSQPSGMGETPTPTRLSPYPSAQPVQAPSSPQYRPSYPSQATLSPRRPTPTPPMGSPMPPSSHTPDRMGHPPNSSTPQSQGSYPSPGASHMSSPGQGLSPGSTVTPSSSLQQLEQMVMPHIGGGPKQSAVGTPSTVASASGSAGHPNSVGNAYYTSATQPHSVSQQSLMYQQTQTPPLQPMQQQQQQQQQQLPHHQYHPQMSPSVNQQSTLTPLGTTSQSMQGSVGGMHHGGTLHNDSMVSPMQQLPTSMPSYANQTSNTVGRPSMGHDVGYGLQQPVNSPGGGPTLTTLTTASQQYHPSTTGHQPQSTSVMYEIQQVQQQLQHLYSLPQSTQNDQKISELQEQLQYLQSQTSTSSGCPTMPPAVNTQPPSSVYLPPTAPQSTSPQLPFNQQQYQQQPHFEPQLEQPHMQHDGMGGSMPVYGDTPQLSQLHDEGLSQDHESHGHLQGSDGLVPLAPPPPPPPPPQQPENGMMDDGVFAFTEDDMQDLPPMLRPVKRGKPKGKSTKPKKPPKSKKGMAATPPGVPGIPPPPPMGDMEGSMPDATGMPPAVMGMPPISAPVSDEASLGMDEMPHLVPEENLEAPRCTPMQEMPIDPMDPDQLDMMGMSELPPDKKKKSKKRKTKERDPNAPPKEPKPKKPKKPKAPKEPKERKEPKTPKKPKTPKQPKEPKVKSESETPPEEGGEPKELKEAKDKSEKKEKKESKPKTPKSTAPREARSKGTPKKKLPKLALKFKKKKRKRLGSSDHSDLEVTPPPSPEETEDGVQKRRSARNTKRKKYTDDIELAFSEDDTLDVDQDRAGGNRAVQVMNVNLEDTMVVEKIMASRIAHRELEVEPGEENESQQPTTIEVEEFFVKYKNLSYIHCDWKTAEELEKGDRKIGAKIKRYKQKKDAMNNFFDFLEEDPYNPDYVEVDRILDVNEIVEFIDDDEEQEAEEAIKAAKAEENEKLENERDEREGEEVANKQPPEEMMEVDQAANGSEDEKMEDDKPKDFDDSSQETIIDKEEEEKEEEKEPDGSAVMKEEGDANADAAQNQMEMMNDEVVAMGERDAAVLEENEEMMVICKAEEAAAANEEEAETGAKDGAEKEPSPAEPKKERKTRIVRHYLVKWRGLPYEDSTWELEEDVDRPKIEQFLRFREPPPKEKWKMKKRPKPPEWTKLEVSPIYKGENTLREYQLEGLNWLTFCWYNGQNCILADEMGLGKTIQSIAFLNEVANYGITGPYLVIAPLSTIGNWQREFETWTDLNVITYHGSSASRNMLQEYEMYYKNEKGERITEVYKFQVMITTFEIVLHDCLELREIPWRCVIIDEAHRLKNRNCKLLEGLRLLNMEHRVLLTGTPLQNNVEELFSLLNFLEPTRFASTEAFLEEFGDLKTENQVDKLKALLKPMMLRRLKEDVEKSLAPKEETIVEVELTNIQKKYYRAILERNFAFLTKGGTGTNMPNLMNTMMELRKCCIHPFLISGAEEQILMEYKAQHSDMQDVSLSAMINSSGKLVLIDKLLPRLRADGHRVLIFSQMVRCLDILEDYLVHRRYPYERIDGRVRGNLRQAAIDRFCKPDSDRFVFLLCTRAGGLGINLTAADTVIIFDSDWNPQNDLQAQARCHRIGQSKAVKVYRLICRNTYEREMFDKASLKLGLDKAVLQSMNSSKENLGMSHQLSKKEIEDLLRKGAYGALMDDDNAGDKFCEEDIDQILQRRTHVITLEGGAKGSTFAKATFSSSNCADIEVDDPNFWEKWAKRANLDVDELKNKNELIVQEPRRRTQTKRFGAEDSMLDLSDLESSDEDDESISARTRGGRRSSKGALGIPRSRNRNRRSGFEKGMGDEIFEDVAPGNWTRAECFKVEKGLLTFGWGRWEECLALGNFKRNFTMKDIEDISRIVLLYCLQNYKGDEKIKGFIWDLITPTEDGETKIHKNHSGLSAPVPRGRKGKKLKKDSKTSCEEDDTLADWAKEDKYNTELLLNDEGYKRHLHRHANKVLLRVRLLYYLKHEVIGDLHDQVVSHVPASEIPLPTPIADGEPPAPWWDQEADKSLLVGVYKHGFERYNVMRQDPALCFFARCGPPDGAALLAEINIFSRNDDEMDEKTSQKDKADKDDDKDDKPDKDDLDELEEPVSPSPSEREPNLSLATPALSVAASEAGTIESSIPDYCPGELGKFPFPSVCDLNTRLRRIITGYQRSFKKEEIKLAQRARRMERREKFEAAIKERELKKRELQQRRWSRREEADFYRTISSFGVEYNHEKQQYDWSRFRAIGRLERKFDDTLTEYYKAFYAMCKRVCGRKLSEEEEERASRCLQRIDLLNKIREEILHHPQLDERLKLCQSSMDLPDWWQCGKHDKDLLIGAARHGLSRMDYHLLHDPELSFKDVLKMKPPTGYPSGGSQWSTPAGGASPVVPFLSGGDEKDVVVSCSETEEKPALKPPPTPVEPAPDSIEKPKTPVDKKPGEDAGDAEVKAPDADEASALPKKEEPMADSKSDVETKMEDDALAATETKDAIKQEEEEEDVKSEDTEPMAITESTVDSSGEGGKEMAEAKTNADSMEESKEAQSVEPIPADQANSDKPQGSEREETKPFSEVDMKEDAAAAAVTTAEQKPDITVVKQEEDEKSDLHSKQDDNMETASQNDELMSQESFNLEYDGGEPTVAQLLAHSARNPIRWPKDKVLQIRLEHICHAVEKNEWPVLRHTFLPSFPVVTTPNIGASVVTTSTTPAPLESSPRPASPVPSTSSQGAASGEATPQATPEHTPRREPTPQDIPISLPEYPSAPTTGSPVFMLNEGGKVPRRRRRRRRAEIEAERAKLRALLSHNIQQQVQQFMPPPPSIMSTPLRASLREDHSYSDDKPSSLPPSTAPTISSSAPPPAHQNSAPRISTTLGSLDLRVKPALSMPVPSVVPPPPPPPVVTPTPPSDTANSPSSPMDLSSSSTPTGIEGAAGNPLVHSTEPSSPTRRTRSSPSSSTPSSASLLNGAVRGRGRGRGRGRWGGGGGSRIDALALNLQARKQQQLLAQQQQQECRDTAPEASSKPASEHEHSKHHLSHADVDEQADTSRLTRKQSPKPDESSRLLRSRTSAVSGASPSLSGSWSTSSMSHRTSSTKHGENIMPNRLPTGLDIMKLGLKPEESTPNPSSLVEQAAAIRQDLKKWLEDHPEVVASNPTLAAAAAAAMAFNPMPSMPPNTELLELPEGRRRGRRPRVDPSKLDFGAITGEENVSVINRLTGKKITGSKAPPLKHLAEWLEKNPMFDVDPKWGPLVREKGNLPDNMRKRIITPSEKRGRRTAASLLASAHQSMNTPTSMMSSFPPASGLNPLNFANAGMLSGFPGMKFFMDPSKGSSASSSSSSTAPSSTASAPIFFPFGGLAGMGLASPLFGFPGFNLQGLQGQNPLSTPGVNSSEKDGSSGDKSKGSEKGVSGSGRSKSASAPITCASSVASTSSATSLPFLYPAPGLLYNPLGLSSFALSPNMSTSFASLAQAGLVNGLGGLGTSAAPVSTTAPSTTSAAASSSSSLNVSSSNIASNIAASASLAKSLLSSSATLPSLTTTTTSAPSVASSSLLAGQDSDDESLKSLMGNDEDEDDDLNGDLDDNLESADKDDSDLDDELQRLKSESSLRRDSSMSSLLKQQVESVLSAAANSKLHQKKADAKQSPSAAVVVPTPKAAGGDTSTSQTTSPAVEKDNPS